MTDWIEALGMVAGVLTTVAFVPRVLRTRWIGNARDFSPKRLRRPIAGVGPWLPHGPMTRSTPIAAANAVTPMLASYIQSVTLCGA